MMPDKPSNKRRLSWRSGRQRKPAPAATPTVRPEATASKQPSESSWRGSSEDYSFTQFALLWLSRLFISFASLALVVYLVQILLTVHRPVPIVTAFAINYKPPFGPLPLAGEDRQVLMNLGEPGDSFFAPITARLYDISNIFTEAATGQELLPYITRSLDSIRPGGPHNDTILIYIAAIAAVNADGAPCLVPPSTIDDPINLKDDEYLTVERLFASIQAAIGTDINAIVVLDCGRDEGGWPFGLDGRAFPAAVEKIVKGSQHERLWVLLPASPGQRPLVSPWQGGSGFAFYFARGMRGAADAAPWGNGDGKVALTELADYLRDRVDHWAVSTFGSRQTPLLMAPGLKAGAQSDQIEKVMVSWAGAVPASLPVAEAVTSDEQWLAERWQVVEKIRGEQSFDRPVRWAGYQSFLLRAERLARAGRQSETMRGEVASRVEQLENRLLMPLTTFEYVLPDERLATRRRETNQSPEQSGKAAEKIAKILKDPKAPIDTSPVELNEWQARVEQGWQWLSQQLGDDGSVSRQTAERWVQYLGLSPTGQSFTPVQLHFVQMLIQWTDPSVWQKYPEHFSNLIRAIDLSRELALGWSFRLDRSPLNEKQLLHANQAFRRAVDLTFVGSPEAVTEASSLVRQSLADFEEVQRRLAERDRAVRTLDRLKAEVPYLLQWWTEERFATRGAADSGLPKPAEIADLLVITRRYDQSFSRLAKITNLEDRETPEEIELLNKQQQQAETAFRRLVDNFLLHCEQLAMVAAESPETLGGIRRVLLTPVIPSDLRMRLLRRAAELEKRFVTQYAAKPEQQSVALPSLDAGDLAAGTIELAGVQYFPVSAFFLPDQPAGGGGITPKRDFARFVGPQAAAVRDIAHRFPNFLAGVRRETANVDPSGPMGANAYLAILEQASSVTHGQATLICDSRRFIEGFDPEITYLANLCHRRILTLATLALDDFWAALKSSDRPYCLEKARRLLELARFIQKNYSTRLGELLQQKLESRLKTLEDQRNQFATVQLTPNQITLAPSGISEPTLGSILLKPRPGVPEGLGAVWFAAGVEAPPLEAIRIPSADKPLQRLPVAISIEARDTTWSLDRRVSQRLEEQQIPALDFISWFRGHRMIEGLRVVPASAARTTRWVARPPTPTQVTVHGEVSQVRSVAIIFDCSGSMGQRMSDGRTRLDAGRAAVAQLLNDLLTAGDWDVSLWLYGHRTQWSRDSRGRYSFKLTSLGEKAKEQAVKTETPFNLVPGDDVEQVLPMQPLTPGVVTQIETLLAPLEAGGETPLYRAISEAIGTDFDGPHRSIPGHVLAVTDGANDQSGGQIVTSTGVTDQLARKNLRRPVPIRIDIIGFALEADAMQRAIRMGQARDLAVGSGGQFYEAADPTALADSLRHSLQLVQWQIADSRFRDKRYGLGESAVLPIARIGQPANYDIVLELGAAGTARRVAAENNTSLELYVAGGGRSVEFRRYDGGTEQGLRDSRAGVVDPLDPRRRVFFGAHLATRTANEVRIPLSVQNDDARSYSQRPTSVWFEVQPRTGEKPTGNPYVFYDMTLQQGRTVPVFDLVAPDWPRDASTAAVKAWVRFDQLSPDLAIAISELPMGESETVSFPGLPDSSIVVTCKNGPVAGEVEVLVNEQHPPELATQLPLLRVQILGAGRDAMHVVEPDSGRVRHRFAVTTTKGVVSPAVRLEFTDRKRLTTGAVSTTLTDAAELIVPIPAE